MSDPLFAPPSLAAIFLVFLLCGLLTFLDDGCPPALPVALLVVHVLEAALLLVVVVVVTVEVGVGKEVLVGVVVGDVVVGVGVGVALLSTSSLSASAPNKHVWGLPGSKSSADGTTTVPSAALSRSVAGVDAARVPRMASTSS